MVINKAITKYGWENFTKHVLEVCETQQSLDDLEVHWMRHYNCLVPNGYNVKQGGKGGKHSEETKRKISEANMGRTPSAETIKRLKEKEFSDQQRERMSKAAIGKIVTDETKKNMSRARSGEGSATAKLTWEIVAELRERRSKEELSYGELSKIYGINRGSIGYIIRGETWVVQP